MKNHWLKYVGQLVWFLVLLGINILFQTALAHDMGTQGICFSIIEEDFQQFIIRQLHDKNIQKKIKADFKTRVQKKVKRPTPVSALIRAKENRIYFIDPTKQTISGGQWLKRNPFDAVNYDKTLVFINGDDLKQRHWLQSFLKTRDQKIFFKIVLVGGNVEEVSQLIKLRVYFDQQGKLTDYFKLTQVPALVFEDKQKKQWQIKTIGLSE